jgi:hypothetical protein
VTYLGQSVWSWLALAVGSVAVGLWLATAGLLPEPHCGWTVEEGQRLEASCASESELEERLAEIRQSRSGQRDWECGAVWEEGRWLEAGCSTVEELEERLESIRHSRSGQRDWEAGL